jgi:hypothetical protein
LEEYLRTYNQLGFPPYPELVTFILREKLGVREGMPHGGLMAISALIQRKMVERDVPTLTHPLRWEDYRQWNFFGAVLDLRREAERLDLRREAERIEFFARGVGEDEEQK